ncbi:MAG: xanthine dehydrogenase accessory protein XdhC, partial [Polaromonas sp.]|nr:xanthine dehydrogenase accessory protein XdhC [Polaromonas sp.]
MPVSRLLPDAGQFLARLALQPAVLVRIAATQGSAPREAGAWMAVFADAVVGTVGGGQLEYRAIAQARAGLAELARSGRPGAAPVRARFALGPSLGQCCGGVVQLDFEPVSASDAPDLGPTLHARLTPLALFGAGHVGQALVQALAPLPFALTWIDSRDGIFPHPGPAQVACEQSAPLQSAVPGLAPGSRVLIMSFSHAEDFDVVAGCLARQRERADLPYIGLIGSRTKWAAFGRRLQARGFTPAELSQVTCPIGIAGIAGKQPAVIAAAVAAQLLQTLERP